MTTELTPQRREELRNYFESGARDEGYGAMYINVPDALALLAAADRADDRLILARDAAVELANTRCENAELRLRAEAAEAMVANIRSLWVLKPEDAYGFQYPIRTGVCVNEVLGSWGWSTGDRNNLSGTHYPSIQAAISAANEVIELARQEKQ